MASSNIRLKFLKSQYTARHRLPDGHYISSNEDKFLIQLGYNDAEGEPDVIRWAKGYCTYFEECEVEILPQEIVACYFNQVKHNIMGLSKNDGVISGHFAVDYDLMLQLGVEGVFSYIDGHEKKVLSTPNPDPRSTDLYKACRIVWKGFQTYLGRYKETADEELKKANLDLQRKIDLEKISEVMGHISNHPPRDFHDAVQLILIYHMVIQFQVGCCSFGRPDRYLYPFYNKSLESGATPEEIKGLIGAWFIKVNEFMSTPQSLMLGGQNENGDPVANDLTMLMLQVISEIDVLNPAMGFAWNDKISDKYMLQILDNYQKGCTHPAIFNDHTIIKSLEQMGMTHNHAVNYTNCTCTEITPEGYSNIFVVGDYINSAQVLLGLIHGKNFNTVHEEIDPSLKSKKSSLSFLDYRKDVNDQTSMHYMNSLIEKNYETFDEFLKAYFELLRELIKNIILHQIDEQKKRVESFAQPLVSIFMHNCLETGLDISWGGALYNYTYPQLVGLPSVVDSLLVVKKLIFEEKKLSFTDFRKILANNFEGNELLRQNIINKYPKWGNDQHEVDSLGILLMEEYYQEVAKYTGIFQNGGFHPGYLCWVMHKEFGSRLGATPDGRLAKKALSNSLAPVAGRGRNGITSICNTAAKIDQLRAGGSATLNLTVLPLNLSSLDQKRKFIKLIETYFQDGGYQLQINVVDKHVLKDAQIHPENHFGLTVKVGGYSAYFVDLDDILQNEIILRNGF